MNLSLPCKPQEENFRSAFSVNELLGQKLDLFIIKDRTRHTHQRASFRNTDDTMTRHGS